MTTEQLARLVVITMEISDLKETLEEMGTPCSIQECSDALGIVKTLRDLSIEGMDITGTDKVMRDGLTEAANECVSNHSLALEAAKRLYREKSTPPIEPDPRAKPDTALAALKKMRSYLDVTIKGMEEGR